MLQNQTNPECVLRRCSTATPPCCVVRPECPLLIALALLETFCHHGWRPSCPPQTYKSACKAMLYKSVAIRKESRLRGNAMMGTGIAKKALTIAKGETKYTPSSALLLLSEATRRLTVCALFSHCTAMRCSVISISRISSKISCNS